MEKKAVIAVSFGTTHPETREKAIGAFERSIEAAFPGRMFLSAWTSSLIRKRMLEKSGENILGVEEAIEEAVRSGATDITIQPSHIMRAQEYEKVVCAAEKAAESPVRIAVGAPLIGSVEDADAAAAALTREFGSAEEGEALVFAGHGSQDGPNEVYVQLEEAMRRAGAGEVFIGTVEAEPGIERVLSGLEKSGCSSVRLLPLMIVAGDHAKNDIFGSGDDSWKSVLERAGYAVQPVDRGIGEYEGIREIFCRHAKAAGEENAHEAE